MTDKWWWSWINKKNRIDTICKKKNGVTFFFAAVFVVVVIVDNYVLCSFKISEEKKFHKKKLEIYRWHEPSIPNNVDIHTFREKKNFFTHTHTHESLNDGSKNELFFCT